MSKRAQKLTVWLLCLCVLLGNLAACAETGSLALTLKEGEDFKDPAGVTFLLYRIGEPDGSSPSAWKATSDFPDVAFPDAEAGEDGRRVWSDDQAKAMMEAAARTIAGNPDIEPAASATTDEAGKADFSGLEAGIYYGVKKPDSMPVRLEVFPFLAAIPTFEEGSAAYDVAMDLTKYTYTTPAPTSVTAEKFWEDDDDFDGVQPGSVTVHLLQNGKVIRDATLSAATSPRPWSVTWTDLPDSDDAMQPYAYTVTEDPVPGYTSNIKGGAITNTHTVEYGALRIDKAVAVETTGDLSEEERTVIRNAIMGRTFVFHVTGPADADYESAGKEKTTENYVDRDVQLTVQDGVSGSVLVGDKLMPGTYVVREVTAGLPDGMALTSGNDISVKVEAGSTADAPAVADFTNTQKLGSLKIIKKVTVSSKPTTGKAADRTYSFTVTGPNNYSKEVEIAIKNGESNAVQLDNLMPGRYVVHENVAGLPATIALVGSNDVGATVTAGATAEAAFTNNLTPTNPPTNPPTIIVNPTPTPVAPPTPTPSPTPVPLTSISGQKVWDDERNAHGTRPSSITVQLQANGLTIRTATISGKGNVWNFTFANLPTVDGDGNAITYTIRENSVSGYTTSVTGTTITNQLIPRTPNRYTTISGTKTWADDDNAKNTRPNYITVRLMRNGVEVERRTVSAANGWQYSFANIPVDDGYGNTYTYTVREDAVSGYFLRTDGYDLINTLLEEVPPVGFQGRTEEDLEGLVDLLDYGVPLWGELLTTGDDTPVYPYVFGGIGGAALIALVILLIVGKRRKKESAQGA